MQKRQPDKVRTVSFFIHNMANFNTQLPKALALNPKTVSDEIFNFIGTMKEYLIKLNIDQIEFKSEDIYGNAIGFYSRATEIISRGEKKAGEPFTGRDTGQWMKDWYVTVLDDMFYFGSTDPKTDDILSSENWLSHDLFGLTEDNLRIVIRERILPFVLGYYRKKLGL